MAAKTQTRSNDVPDSASGYLGHLLFFLLGDFHLLRNLCQMASNGCQIDCQIGCQIGIKPPSRQASPPFFPPAQPAAAAVAVMMEEEEEMEKARYVLFLAWGPGPVPGPPMV